MMWYSQSSVALSSRVTQRQCGISDGSWALTEGTASLPSYGDQFSSKNKKRGPLSKTYLLLVCLHWKNGSYVARNDWTQCREISSKKALSKKPSSFPSFQLGPKLWAAFHSLIVEVGIKDCAVSPGLWCQRNSSAGCMKLHLSAHPEPYGGKPHQKEMKLWFVHTHTHTQMPDSLLSVVFVWTTSCHIGLDYSQVRPHRRSIQVFRFLSGILKLPFLTSVGFWSWNPPWRTSGPVLVRFSSKHK